MGLCVCDCCMMLKPVRKTAASAPYTQTPRVISAGEGTVKMHHNFSVMTAELIMSELINMSLCVLAPVLV